MKEQNSILVVDDNGDNLKVLDGLLSEESYQVFLANEGQNALDFAQKRNPDLILLDIMMPGMNGFEVCDKLKDNQQTKEIPVIFISALEETEKKLKSFKMGGVDYITKPFHKSEVLARIKTQLELRETKKQLKIRNQEKNILLENIDTQIWYLKSPNRYGKVNSSHAEFLGRAKEEIEGELLDDILPKQEADLLIEGNKKVFASKEKLETKEWIKNANGEERLLKITKTPKLGPANNIQYLVCSADDITANQKLLDNLKESKRKFRSYVDYAPDGIFIVDSRGNYLDVNSEGLQMVEYSKDELLNMNFSELVADEDSAEAINHFKKLLKKGQIRHELRLKKKDGSLLDVILEAKKITSDSYLAFAKDITEKKQAEKSLKRKVELEQLSTELSKEFIDLKDESIEAKIESGLERIGKFMDVNYAFIYLFSADMGRLERSFEWYPEEFEDDNIIKVREKIHLSDFPWLFDRLKKEELIDIADIDNLPARAKEFKKLLSKQGIKATLIFPLKYNNNLIGALAFDNRTKTNWDRDELSLFKVIADIFVNVLHRKKNEAKLNEYYRELESQKSELERLYDNLESEFEKAKQLHQQFLPTELPDVPDIDYDTYFQPSQKLGGDFYNLIKLDGQLLFYLADVSGHGLDGAMMDIFLREMINNYLLNQDTQNSKLKPNKLIKYVAERYRNEKFPADYFICLLVGVLDLNKMKVKFANAGFQFAPIQIKREGQLSTIDCGGMPISSAVSKTKFNSLYGSDNQYTTVDLARGDSLFLTTDGLIEEQVADEMYGLERVKEILADNYNSLPQFINTRIKNDFEKFSGSLVGQDDLTFMTIKRDLEVLDRFNRKIKSDIEQMHQVQERAAEFIAPYCEMASLVFIGLQEIVTNAIEHGNQMDPSQEVKIEIEVTRETIKFIVTDNGAGFDWRDRVEQEFDIEEELESERERGRGIKLANQLYDKICYNDRGNQAHLFKLRN